MKTAKKIPLSRWTLPEGHRANDVAHIWAFPLFFSNRAHISVLNNPVLDPLFRLIKFTRTFQDAEGNWPFINEGTTEQRINATKLYIVYQTACNVVANFIIEGFGWVETSARKPSSFIKDNPIPLVDTREEAAQVGYKVLYDLKDSKWRAYLYDTSIHVYCSEYRKLIAWSYLNDWPSKGKGQWDKFPFDPAKDELPRYNEKSLQRVQLTLR